MKNHTIVALICGSLLVNACDSPTVKQWMNPDKEAKGFEQPSFDSINSTTEKMAIEATNNADYKRAGQFYTQLVDSKKGSPDDQYRYKLGLAESARRIGQNEAALDMYEQLYKEKPTDIATMEGRGLTLMAAGRTADAGRQLAEVIEKDPKRWRALNALGILFVTKNMIPEAMAYYTEALRQSPDNPAILNNVGLSQAVDKNYARAFEAFEQGVRVSKTDAQRKQLSLNMAMVYGISGDLETAKTIAAKFLEGPALDNNLGLYAHLAKDDALAKTYLDMALTDAQVYYKRAWENRDIIENKGGGGK
jgi:Flp pilus assembly protein TadD